MKRKIGDKIFVINDHGERVPAMVRDIDYEDKVYLTILQPKKLDYHSRLGMFYDICLSENEVYIPYDGKKWKYDEYDITKDPTFLCNYEDVKRFIKDETPLSNLFNNTTEEITFMFGGDFITIPRLQYPCQKRYVLDLVQKEMNKKIIALENYRKQILKIQNDF